jgi:hypothetical protein
MRERISKARSIKEVRALLVELSRKCCGVCSKDIEEAHKAAKIRIKQLSKGV